jgi:spermidine/putrescine transport system substrate-binding protein
MPDERTRQHSGRPTVNFANWSLYMDPSHPELARFTAETGIEVNYQEVIEEMVPWYARIQPQLAEGKSIDFDLMVLTNGIEFRLLASAGYLTPLDHTRLANFAANAGAAYRHRPYDPGNVYSVPWASGITGLAVAASVAQAPASLADLWQPQFRGRIGLYADTADLGSLAMFGIGVNPPTSTPDDWRRAADWLAAKRDAGYIQRFYEHCDLAALERGELLVAQAWSGDVFQKNFTDGAELQFVIPAEGGTIWTDNFTIPVTAANPEGALALIDFFYRIDVAASLTEYINFITPVPAVQQHIAARAAAASGEEAATLRRLAHSPLVFPTATNYAHLCYHRDFASAAEWLRYDSVFRSVLSP